jgi:hypothetical protein
LHNSEKIVQLAFERDLITAIPDSETGIKTLSDLLIESHPELEDDIQQDSSPAERLYQHAIADELKGIPTPSEPKGKVPDLPLDLTDCTDTQLMKLHSAYNALSARVGWLYAVEEAGEAAAKTVINNFEEEYFNIADRKDFGGKPKAQSLLKAEAVNKFPELKVWKERYSKHSIDARKYKSLLERFDNVCDRISRHWTMRTENREHS